MMNHQVVLTKNREKMVLKVCFIEKSCFLSSQIHNVKVHIEFRAKNQTNLYHNDPQNDRVITTHVLTVCLIQISSYK